MKNETFELRNADKKLINNLITGSNILYIEGQSDMHNGQISGRLMQENEFWIKGASIGFEEITEDNIIRMGINGEIIHGYSNIPPEWNLHSEIYKSREDVRSIIHTHAPNAILFGATGLELLPISHEACPFYKKLNVFDETTNTVLNSSIASQVVKSLGNNNAVVLRNHGIVTVGSSVKQAILYALLLEKACYYQLKLNGYPSLLYSNIEDVNAKNEFIFSDSAISTYWDYYSRKVERLKANGFR